MLKKKLFENDKNKNDALINQNNPLFKPLDKFQNNEIILDLDHLKIDLDSSQENNQ